MDNLKDDLYYLERMRRDLVFIIQNMKDVSIVQFEQKQTPCNGIHISLRVCY